MMLIDFFFAMRAARIPVSLREFLDLLAGLSAHVAFADWDDFYALARLTLVKDEKYYDAFDRVFGEYVNGVNSTILPFDLHQIPEDWLSKQLEHMLTPEEMAQIKSQGDLARLMALFKQRLAEQKERHQGGNKWIGTGGTSPFGAYGYNPEGFRIGQHASRHRRAVKVWDEREFKDLAGDAQLDVRNLQMALRRLRVFARTGAAEQLNLPATIAATAKNAGMLDLQMQRERRNAVKVLLLLDIGGSMDDYIALCERLFAACKNEFKHLHLYYFHNCVYESLWPSASRRGVEQVAVWDVINRYDPEYKLILVGDAMMSPYELVYPGGSVEHMNAEAGEVWLQRLTGHFPHAVWLNPAAERYWAYTPSVDMVAQRMHKRMFPLTLSGIEAAMAQLMA